MDVRLSSEQIAFRNQVRAFIDERLPVDIRQRLRAGHAPRKEDVVAWQRILHERGWAAPHWPRAYGGADLGQAERLILLDEMYRAPAPVPLVFNVGMLGPVLLKFGTETQKQELLPKLARLDLWFCQGFSEPGAGSDLASLRTAAVRHEDHYIVNGQKIWTTGAHLADWMFALVRTDTHARKQEGISFLLIDMRSQGVSVRPVVSIDGQHHLNEVFFDNVRVPVSNLVGQEHRGWDCAKYLLISERTSIAHIGLCRERLDRALELAARPDMRHKRLIDDPVLQDEVARIDADLRALEVTNWRFLTSPEQAATNPAYASVLKLKGAELQQSITELLQHIIGTRGMVRCDAQHAGGASDGLAATAGRYFFARAATIYGGSNEIQRDILARSIVG